MAYITQLCSHRKDYEAQRLNYTRENATVQSVQCLLHLNEDVSSIGVLA